VECSIAFKFGTEFHHVTGDTPQMFKVRGQRSSSQRKVMYQQQKRNNTATVQRRQTWHGVVIKAGKGWRGSHSQFLRLFLVAFIMQLCFVY